MRINPFNEIYRSKEYSEVDEPSDFPMIVDIELTNDCNLKCKMCSRQIMTRDIGYMSKELFKKIVDECAEHNTAIRLIRWGEPFLHPHILEFCKYVKDKGLPLHITTNGMVLSESQMIGIILCKVDSIIFSMQGVTPDGYEHMRKGAIYDLLYTNIMKLLELRRTRDKPFIHISTTVTDETDKEINAFKDAWKDVVDSVGIGKTRFSYLGKEDNIKKEYRDCKEPWQKLSVDWDGKVSACCNDYDNLLTIGDINERSLFNLWNYNDQLDGIRAILNNMNHRCLTLCSKCFHTYTEF